MVAGVIEMRGHTERHQRQSPPIWVLLHLAPVFHAGDRRLFHFLAVQVTRGDNEGGGAPEDGAGRRRGGAEPGVQVPAELGRSPLRRFGHHRSASHNACHCAALRGWVNERENPIWVMK
jgi:hypothetical protein